MKGGIGKSAVDLTVSFEIVQINQLSVVAYWGSSRQAIMFGKDDCGRETLSIYLVACRKGSVQLSNTFFFHRAMMMCNKTMNVIYPTVFKDAYQEDEAFRILGTSPRECTSPLSGDTEHPTKQKTTQSSLWQLSSAPGPQPSLMH